MSPTRTSADGCFRLQWQRKEVGRITSSSGAHTVTGWRNAMALLDKLYERDELDVLRAIQKGTITMKEVSGAEKAKAFGRGDAMHSVTMRRRLWSPDDEKGGEERGRIDAWLDGKTDHTHVTYRFSLTKFRSLAGLRANATIAELLKVDWEALHQSSGADGVKHYQSAANWNHLRRAISRFLTIELGDVYHPSRRAILKRIPRMAERARRVEITIAEFWRLVTAAEELVRPRIVTLAVTGMRLGEYERARKEHLHPDRCAIDIQGSKTEGSTATIRVAPELWPWIEQGVPLVIARRRFQERFHAAAKKIGRPDLRVHDLRHCTAVFAMGEGAPLNAVRDLMRHERAEQTMDYTLTGNLNVAAAAVGRALTGEGALSLSHTTPAKRKQSSRAKGA